MFSSIRTRTIWLVALDSTLICLCGLAALYLHQNKGPIEQLGWGRTAFLLFIWMAVLQGSFHLLDLYHLRMLRSRTALYSRILLATGVASVALTIVIYTTSYPLHLREIAMTGIPMTLVLMGAWRLLAHRLFRSSKLAERVLVIGTETGAIDLVREVLQRRENGHFVVGFVGEDPSLVGRSLINPRVVGTVTEIEDVVRRYKVDRIVVAMDDCRGRLPLASLLDLKLRDEVAIEERASFYENLTGKIATDRLRPSTLIFAQDPWSMRLYRRARKVLDVVVAACGLIVALPVILLTAIAIKLDSRGPVLYRQERVGLCNRPFQILKFRSMRLNAEDAGPAWAREFDARATRVGRLLRKFHLDELPQLINVIRGEMSLIGPRPERPVFVQELQQKIPYYSQRHLVKPGVTGWAQVRYSYGASVEDTIEKLQHDFYYIKNQSPLLDAIVLLETARIALFGKLSR